MPSESLDVVVVGPGFAGLAVARMCEEAGLRVAVLERRTDLEQGGAGLALQAPGFAALERLGLTAPAMRLGDPFTIVEQCDPTGRVRMRFDFARVGTAMMTVSRAEIIGVLGAGLPVRFGAEVTRLLPGGGVAYRDGDGEHEIAARWVVGADGRGSQTRELAGIRSRGRTRTERYVTGLVAGEQLRAQGRLFLGPGWADGVLPHPGRIYFFDYVNEENAATVEARDFDAWAEIYAARVPDAAHVLAHVASFDDMSVLAGRQHVALPRVCGRVALAGDAAASVHPHSGQGANFALEDGLALGAALASGEDAEVRAYGRRHDRRRARYVPYSIFAGRMLDASSPPWAVVRAASLVPGRVPRRALAYACTGG